MTPPPLGCIFCEVARHERAAHVVHEDDDFITFLDKSPLFPGHCLLVPKRHVDTLVDLPSGQVGPLFALVQRLSRAVETAMNAEGFFVAINNRVSQSVPHLHVHVVPRRRKDGLKGFFWPRSRYAGEQEMSEVAASIARAMDTAEPPSS